MDVAVVRRGWSCAAMEREPGEQPGGLTGVAVVDEGIVDSSADELHSKAAADDVSSVMLARVDDADVDDVDAMGPKAMPLVITSTICL